MTRPQLVDQIKQHEGTGPVRDGRMFPYKDSRGVLTIGWGRNLTANGVTINEAEQMLSDDIDAAIRACHAQFPWFEQLDTVRQSVVIELVFNMGMKTWLQFVRTIAAIERRDFGAAGKGLRQSDWYQQVGAKRGDKLIDQMTTGLW